MYNMPPLETCSVWVFFFRGKWSKIPRFKAIAHNASVMEYSLIMTFPVFNLLEMGNNSKVTFLCTQNIAESIEITFGIDNTVSITNFMYIQYKIRLYPLNPIVFCNVYICTLINKRTWKAQTSISTSRFRV